MEDEEHTELSRRGQILRDHPVITGVLVVCTALGILGGVAFLDPGWSLLRRALGGALVGSGLGILFTATKMIG